jgi:mRNA-degrading endonuclease toxin of MazEF toxin-antitoxin module
LCGVAFFCVVVVIVSFAAGFAVAVDVDVGGTAGFDPGVVLVFGVGLG